MVFKIKSSIRKKSKKITLVISDVDGVLTDGGMYYSEVGEVMRKFNTKDGMGVELLRNQGIRTILVTKENSKIVRVRAKKLQINDVYVGIKNKEIILPELCKKFNVKYSEIAYIGDDVNDIGIMKKVGFSACPADGMDSVKNIVDYTCNSRGGEGAFREVADLILSTKLK